MKSLQTQIKDFFGFSKAQANGFVALILLSTVILFSNPVYKMLVGNRPKDFSKEKGIIDSLTVQWGTQLTSASPIDREKRKTVLFHFNPNKATATELDSLGFSEKLTKRLINYRSKGGEFRIKSDVKKLYGMDSLFYISLHPFIQLPEKIEKAKTVALKKELKKELITFDLNQADSAQLTSIFGIGHVLAKRIIKYRDALGGFINNDQLKEVYGLDSAVIKRIEKASFLMNDFTPHKLNINLLDERALSSHPYFSKKMAKSVVTYRFQHGNYHSVDDLRKIESLEKTTLDKVFPYLTVE